MVTLRVFYFSGSRVERAQKSLNIIGGAVVNGGTTTLLAVVVLCDSKSHAFITFFKVFFLCVLFGLYHALVFCPVLLSLRNPFRTMTDKLNCKNCKGKKENAVESLDKQTGGEVNLTTFTNETFVH